MEEAVAEVEKKNPETPAQRLEQFKKRGFLFHGSSNNSIDTLEPKSTYDPKTPRNTDTAVFATDNIAWTTIFGIYGGHTEWSTDVENGIVTAKIPIKDRELIEKTTGTVYVLPKEPFDEQHGEQYKSHKPVKPTEKVSVTLNDFYELGGRIEWT
ncbi:MAG: hypothetical protein M1268_00790 [Patescibacteria group bacterium]|nr:hypothetical protein [Actinomycetota bacterium]MCL5438509.1 hypothetical protein [Patescibacteria group bacterium]